jgi:hypothetical protein
MAHNFVDDYSGWEITGSINGFTGKEKRVNPGKESIAGSICSDDK